LNQQPQAANKLKKFISFNKKVQSSELCTFFVF